METTDNIRPADTILHNAKIAVLDDRNTTASAIAIGGGRVIATGSNRDMEKYRGPGTKAIDAQGRTVIPGLYDSHQHLIRGGLNFNLELRWDGVPSLADAMTMLREQALRTPPPQWVRVVGGWTEQQFAERRQPTIEEINRAAPETPVFLLHLYDRALLNGAALRAVGYTKETPNPPGGEIQRDGRGNPTGMLIARPNAGILYSTLAKGPKLSHEDQVNSTRHFMRELNRLGVTSVADAGGGFQNYPDDYRVIEELHAQELMTVRIAYNLFTQKPKQEMEDFRRWTSTTKYAQGDNFLRHNGAGEMLVFSAADFEDFLEPRPNMPNAMEEDLEQVVRLLAVNRWPFRLHATYDETIGTALNIFEKVNDEVPLNGLHWFFDHAETVTDANLDRIKNLGGGIAVQDRMAFQGEYFVDRYGSRAAERTPPFKRMLEMGIPVGAGTDATRVSSHNPFIALHWLVTGKTVGGLSLYPEKNLVDRTTALGLYTHGSAWFSNEQDTKGTLEPGKLADLAVLSDAYFDIPEHEIPTLHSVLTIVDGKIVYGVQEFAHLSPPLPPASPDWSPVRHYGNGHEVHGPGASVGVHRCAIHRVDHRHGLLPEGLFCPCFAF